MGRNRLIYALADFALVVSCDAERGGTWAGATEALKAGWVPVFAAEAAELPEGNRRLAQLGALAFPWPFPAPATSLKAFLADQAPSTGGTFQPTLF